MTERGELRQDPVTGKWVVIAPARARRPREFARVVPPRPPPPAYRDTCPFCNLRRFPQARETLFLPRGPAWRVRAFPNKFPAFRPAPHVRARKTGPYTVMEAVGYHEVITVRDHHAFLARMGARDLRLYLRAWRDRYRALMVQPSVNYIQLIENHGRESGGSVEHPHLQLFAIPVLPSDEVLDLLQGAENYYRQNGSCAYCDILAFERAARTRLVSENARFTVLCPFTSRVPAEFWVVPKAHSPGFEGVSDEDLAAFGTALQDGLRRLDTGFSDPAYNLYLYSAPCDTEGFICEQDEFAHFHWHAEVLPRLNIWGGFELATGLEIHPLRPEEAAAYLRQSGPAQSP